MKKMKKWISMFVLAAAVYLGLIVTGETVKADVILDLKFDEVYQIGYEDHYQFNMELPGSGSVKFKFISDYSRGEIAITIYDETGTKLFAKNYTGSFNETVDLKAGCYTVGISDRVWNENSSPEIEGILGVEYVDAKESYKENAIDTNDQSGAASYIKSVKDKTIKGHFSENDIVDYYKFKLTKPQKLALTFKSALKNVELHLYNSNLDYELRYDLSAGTNKYTQVLPKGTYYVSFSIDENAVKGTYSLKFKSSDLKETSIKSLKSTAKKTVKTTWKKASGVSGYQVQIATNNKFTKGKKTYTTTNTSKTIKKLTSKKTYYVRVRTYTIAENGKKCYSDWSTVKKVKVK